MTDKNKIYYWCPFINNVATIKAVYNSAMSLKINSKNKFEGIILDVFGEWEKSKFFNQEKIKFFKLNNSTIIKSMFSQGFVFSRLKYLLIFFSILHSLILLFSNLNCSPSPIITRLIDLFFLISSLNVSIKKIKFFCTVNLPIAKKKFLFLSSFSSIDFFFNFFLISLVEILVSFYSIIFLSSTNFKVLK